MLKYFRHKKYVTGCVTEISYRCVLYNIRFHLTITCPYTDKLDDEYPSRGNLVIIKNRCGISNQLAYVEEFEKKGGENCLLNYFEIFILFHTCIFSLIYIYII